MKHTIHMNREERLARIGQILAKGVTLLLMAERQEVEAAKQIKPFPDQGGAVEAKAVIGLFQDDVDASLSIYAFIKRVGSASPRQIQRVLQISKATVFRKVNGLLDAGVIIRTGSTTAVRYQIAPTARCQPLVTRDTIRTATNEETVSNVQERQWNVLSDRYCNRLAEESQNQRSRGGGEVGAGS